ncbi:hypothetical protein FHY35_000806 [Xanthomonas arboricola]|nr:hypothetical protein [Xanthomonas arboricola]
MASPAALQSSNPLIALECISRRRRALTARGTCRKPVPGARWRHPCRHTVPQAARTPHKTVAGCFVENHARRPTQLVLVRPPSRDLTRHGCRVSAYRDVLAACPARVGGQGPCSKPTASRARREHLTRKSVGCLIENHTHRPSRQVLARPPSRDLTRHGCRVRAYRDVLAACPAMVGGQGPCSQAAEAQWCCEQLYNAITPTRAPAPAARRSPPAPACAPPHH